ncbi:MAG: alpha/beta fold hydrolase [Proteobacteria bacterium]|nr:alpha/beta fold hydrolase [Pseudomonadota bacterium]
MIESDTAVTLEPAAAPVATVIWLHGLGADGYDFVPVVPELRLPAALAVRFIFPHAPVRPVTVNGGYEMRAWYDIVALTPEGRDAAEGLDDSVARVGALVAAEQARGMAPGRIVLAGFSQGGAVALHAGLAAAEPPAGVVALSTYLPRAEATLAARPVARAALPILQCHGSYDTVVTPSMGVAARDALRAAGHSVEWHEYPMAHEVSVAELAAISAWIHARLG